MCSRVPYNYEEELKNFDRIDSAINQALSSCGLQYLLDLNQRKKSDDVVNVDLTLSPESNPTSPIKKKLRIDSSESEGNS